MEKYNTNKASIDPGWKVLLAIGLSLLLGATGGAGVLNPEGLQWTLENKRVRRPSTQFIAASIPDTLGAIEFGGGVLRHIGDINGDGEQDVALGPDGVQSSKPLALISSQTGQKIREHQPSKTISWPVDVAGVGDVDGDGCDDYVLATLVLGSGGLLYHAKLQTVSGIDGRVVAERQGDDYSRGVRLAGSHGAGMPGKHLVAMVRTPLHEATICRSPIAMLDAESLETVVEMAVQPRTFVRGMAVVDWQRDGVLDVVALHATVGVGARILVSAENSGEWRELVSEGALLGKVNGSMKSISTEWGRCITEIEGVVVFDGPAVRSVFGIDSATGKLRFSRAVKSAIDSLGGFLPVEDMNGDSKCDVLVWGETGFEAERGVHLAYVSSHNGLTVPAIAVAPGDAFGACLVALPENEGAIAVFDTQGGRLQLRDPVSGATWGSQDFSDEDWEEVSMHVTGDFNGEGRNDAFLEGWRRPRAKPSAGIKMSGRGFGARSNLLATQELKASYLISGATGEPLWVLPGVGVPVGAHGDGPTSRDEIVCLKTSPERAVLVGLDRDVEIPLGQSRVVLRPVSLAHEDTGNRLVCVIAIDANANASQLHTVSIDSGRVTSSESIDGVISAVKAYGDAETFMALRNFGSGYSVGRSELILMTYRPGSWKTVVVAEWGPAWGPAVALDVSGGERGLQSVSLRPLTPQCPTKSPRRRRFHRGLVKVPSGMSDELVMWPCSNSRIDQPNCCSILFLQQMLLDSGRASASPKLMLERRVIAWLSLPWSSPTCGDSVNCSYSKSQPEANYWPESGTEG